MYKLFHSLIIATANNSRSTIFDSKSGFSGWSWTSRTIGGSGHPSPAPAFDDSDSSK